LVSGKQRGSFAKDTPRRGIQRSKPHDHIPTAEITSYRCLKPLYSEPQDLDPTAQILHYCYKPIEDHDH
jgi:hypothetical protein